MKILMIILAVVLGLLVIVEVGLRLTLGLGNPLLYIPDPEIGYLIAPNQQVRRSGNRIIINQYSMRTHPIEAKRPHDTLRVFLVGDSIANGAWWTDQDETIAALMKKNLQGKSPVEVLNASANSWSPRNELAYLKRFGLFESQVLVLLINTDDLFGAAPTSIPVGRDRNYPTHKPLLALIELFTYFILPAPVIPEMEQVNAETGDRVGFNLAAIKSIKELARENQAQFLLAMTPLKREIDPTSQKDYEKKARKRLSDFTKIEGINYVDFLPIFRLESVNLYRDNIHLSPAGNHLVSNTLSQSLKQ